MRGRYAGVLACRHAGGVRTKRPMAPIPPTLRVHELGRNRAMKIGPFLNKGEKMLKQFTNPRLWPTRLLLFAGVAACLVWLALTVFRRPVSVSAPSSSPRAA